MSCHCQESERQRSEPSLVHSKVTLLVRVQGVLSPENNRFKYGLQEHFKSLNGIVHCDD